MYFKKKKKIRELYTKIISITPCTERQLHQKVESYYENLDELLKQVYIPRDPNSVSYKELFDQLKDNCQIDTIEYKRCPDEYSFLQRIWNKCQEFVENKN